MRRLPPRTYPVYRRPFPVAGPGAPRATEVVHYHYHAAPDAPGSPGVSGKTVGQPAQQKKTTGLLHWIQDNPLLMAIATTVIGALVGSFLQRGFDRAANRKERQDKREELQQLFRQYRAERDQAELLGPDAVQALDREYELIFEAITKG